MEIDERIWVLDTEAKGENPGEIIELAAVEMEGLVLTGRYRQWRFRPKEPVNYRATRVKPQKAYDTLRMVRRAFPDLERHRLSHMGDHMGLSDMAVRITGRKAHSAFYDAVLCGLILRHVADPLQVEERAALLAHSEIMAIRRQKEALDALQAAKAALRRKMRGTTDVRPKRKGPSADI
jgi:DNA polymerase-3 subunit epsilon